MTIFLDPQIRDWVLLPIVFITVCIGVCRTLLVQLVASGPGQTDLEEMKHKQRLARSARMRQNGHVIDEQSIAMRVSYFSHPKTGIFTDESIKKPGPAMPDTEKMLGPMKTQMITMVPQIVMMNFVQYFFAGFILGKVPFRAPSNWRTMLQRGIDITTLDVSYVSSLSWYFVVMFGTRSLIGLLLAPASGAQLNDGLMMQAQMGMGQQQQGAQAFDPKAKYDQENKNVSHFFSVHKKQMVVPKAISRLARRIRDAGDSDDI